MKHAEWIDDLGLAACAKRNGRPYTVCHQIVYMRTVVAYWREERLDAR